MSEHTPGPWRVAFGNRLEIHGPKDEIGWPKSIVYNAGLCTDEEAQANARLIAAAPELLAACIDALEVEEQMAQCPDSELASRLRAVITKAKGENK
jgi:hypothetical protein